MAIRGFPRVVFQHAHDRHSGREREVENLEKLLLPPHAIQPSLDASMPHELANVDVRIVQNDVRVLARVLERRHEVVPHVIVRVVAIDEEITVKTVLHRRTGLWLKPENQQQGYPLIRLRPEQHVRIAGKVIAVFRPLSA